MNLLQTYTPHLLWTGGVLVSATLLHLLTAFIHRRLLRRDAARLGSQGRVLMALRRIVLGFIWIVAALLLSYLLFEEETYDLVTENLLRTCWFFLVLAGTVVAAAASQMMIERAESQGNRDPTTFRFFKNVIVVSIYGLGALLFALAIPGLQSVAQSALAGAGVLAVVAGMASQDALSNIVGGLLIVLFRPFKLGDTVAMGTSLIGAVEDITLRHTVIRTAQNQRIVVPNASLNKETVTNYELTDPRACMWIEVGVAYDTDIASARQVIASCCADHPAALDIRTAAERDAGQPMVRVQVVSLGDSAVTLRARVWAADHDQGCRLRCDLLEQLLVELAAHDIEIPFPHRTVELRPRVALALDK